MLEAFPTIFKTLYGSRSYFVSCDDLRIIDRNYCNNKWKRKIAEALLIKYRKPPLNGKEKSVALKLVN